MLEFYKTDRRPLTHEERAYWSRLTSSIAKVGVELEFNLHESEGMCSGIEACQCINLSDTASCWKDCADLDLCADRRDTIGPLICANACPTCSPQDCDTCSLFSFECRGIECNMFTPYCVTCDAYDPGCTTCPKRYDASKDPKEMRNRAIRELHPSKCYGCIGDSGVMDVVKDGSLLGDKGMEIITTGRRPNYWTFHKMLSGILDTAKKNGGYLNERSSTHMHLLLSYYSRLNNDGSALPMEITELDGKPVPEIILANLHQLTVRYQNALVWMGMGLSDMRRLTRWEKFRVSIMNTTAVTNHMKDVKDQVCHNSGGNKYGFVNYLFTEFDNDGDVSRFHVEFRGIDGINSASALSAFACLYYAILMEAIDLSCYGVLRAFTRDEYMVEEGIKAKLLNNMKGYGDGDRFADTSKLAPHFDHLARRSMELLGLVKHHLESVGPAYDVLVELAKKPAAIRRAEGLTWEDIERQLAIDKPKDENEHEDKVRTVIDLMQVGNAVSPEQWIHLTSTKIGTGLDVVGEVIRKLMIQGRVFWSKPLGTFKMKVG